MIVVKVSFVEELVKYMLSLAPGSFVMMLRRGTKLLILTEIGGEPLVFVSRIPRAVSGELEAIYREFAHGKFVYLDEKGAIVVTDELPKEVMPYTAIGMILDVDNIWVGDEGAEALKRFLHPRKGVTTRKLLAVDDELIDIKEVERLLHRINKDGSKSTPQDRQDSEDRRTSG